jgi:hypothetical protein
MGDSDESYDFSALSPFVEKLREGYDLVMGNRYRDGIAPGAMPPMHRYFGNPLLTAVGRLGLVICSVLFLLLGGQTLLAGFYFGLINLVAERRAQRISLSSEAVEFETTHSRDGGVT